MSMTAALLESYEQPSTLSRHPKTKGVQLCWNVVRSHAYYQGTPLTAFVLQADRSHAHSCCFAGEL